MAIALVGSGVSAGSAAGLAITTGTYDTSGANFIVVALADYEAATPCTITDNKGNDANYTALTRRVTTSGEAIRIWYCLNATTGTGHIFTASNGGTGYPSLCVLAFSGVKTSLGFDVQNGAGAGGASPSIAGSVTPTEDNELVIFGTAYGASHSGTSINGGFTLQQEVNYSASAHFGSAIAYLIQTTAAAANPSYAFTGSNGWSAAQATFKAAAAGGGGSIRGSRNAARMFGRLG